MKLFSFFQMPNFFIIYASPSKSFSYYFCTKIFHNLSFILPKENDWVYVISEENQEGFIPHSYCAQYGSQLATLALNVKKKMPRYFHVSIFQVLFVVS